MARTSIRLHTFGRDHSVEVTREKFESLTAHLLQLTKLTTEAAIEDAKLDWSQIARIVLVGGSTHMPAVRKMLKEASGLTPDAGVNPVLAVSLGASIYAHMLETGHSMKAIRCQPLSGVDDEPQGAQAPMSELAFADDGPATVPVVALPNVRFVTAHGVGLKVHAKGHWRNEVLIPKNTPVPVQITKRFRTHGESGRANRVTISITQGDTRDVELAEALGIGRIEGIPPGQPAGSPVDVTMEFDDQGRLHTRAVYVPTGQSMRVSLEVQGGLRGDEVQSYRDMLVKSGIGRPFRVEEAISRIDDFDDDNELPMIEPV
jgi:molecular chaperone DnaK